LFLKINIKGQRSINFDFFFLQQNWSSCELRKRTEPNEPNRTVREL